MRILVVEDEHKLAGVLKRGLEEHGYAVDLAYDGDDGLAMATEAPYDLLVLDIMLPKLDGLSLCDQLRAQNKHVPVLMLTARDAVDERSLRLLRHLLERQQLAADDVNEFIILDEEFHLSIAKMAGLARTARMIASLRGVLWLLGTQIVYREARRPDVMSEHTAVLLALERRDADAAVDAITRHISDTARAALALYSDRVATTSDERHGRCDPAAITRPRDSPAPRHRE